MPNFRSDFEGEKSWVRIESGFSSGKVASDALENCLTYFPGQCVVTLGTGTSHNIQWRDVNLLPSHSYAVIGEWRVIGPSKINRLLQQTFRRRKKAGD